MMYTSAKTSFFGATAIEFSLDVGEENLLALFLEHAFSEKALMRKYPAIVAAKQQKKCSSL